MARCPSAPLGGVVLGAGGMLAVVPGGVSAHGVAASRFRAPVPLAWIVAGAAATVAVTALWVGVRQPAWISNAQRRHVATLSATAVERARLVASLLFFGVVLVVLVAGLVGRQVGAANLATVFTWPVWFNGLAIVAILVGNPWVTLSPWRTGYRALTRLEGRPIALLGSCPRLIAAWPAVVGFVVLVGVIENLTVLPRSPRLTTGLLAVYALLMLGGAIAFGRQWFDRADPLGLLYAVLGRVAPLRLSAADDGHHRLSVRPPWIGCLEPVASLSIAVFAVATVYTVSFDGFTNTRLFQIVLFDVRTALGTGPATSVFLYGAGLVGFVATFVLASRVADTLGGAPRRGVGASTRAFAPTVLPIAAAYEIAHNYPYVLRNVGRFVALLLDPFVAGIGPVEPLGWLTVPAFWGSQVVLIVLGHVFAVVAAQQVADRRYGSRRSARRGHLPLVVSMIGYTVLSLWIVSQPIVGT